jgi:uncharacterized tellurite resistance protein B-like protein
MQSKKTPRKRLVMTLAKVVIAAAWADGEISHDEINCLKDLLFQLRGLDARGWASLEIYMNNPISAKERDRLLLELKGLIRSSRDKQMALQALDDMACADGAPSESEQQVIDEIKTAIDSASVGIFSGIGNMVSGALERRSKALASAPNRELNFEEFVRNKILFSLRQQQGDLGLDIPEKDLKKLSLTGGLMARVANIDRQTTSAEIGAMIEAMQQGWKISSDAAAFVAEIAVSASSLEVDYFRMTREFFTNTTNEERVQLLDVLFAVAAADGEVSLAETEEIRRIAGGLKLTHKQFINAKLAASRAA